MEIFDFVIEILKNIPIQEIVEYHSEEYDEERDDYVYPVNKLLFKILPDIEKNKTYELLIESYEIPIAYLEDVVDEDGYLREHFTDTLVKNLTEKREQYLKSNGFRIVIDLDKLKPISYKNRLFLVIWDYYIAISKSKRFKKINRHVKTMLVHREGRDEIICRDSFILDRIGDTSDREIKSMLTEAILFDEGVRA